MTIWNKAILSQEPILRKSNWKTSHYTVRKETRKVEPRRRGVLFHQHYAPAHMSPQALAAIRNSGLELLANLDLASDFYLFPKPKEFLRGRKFAYDAEVTYKWLARRARTILQLNPCFGELLDQVASAHQLQPAGEYVEKRQVVHIRCG